MYNILLACVCVASRITYNRSFSCGRIWERLRPRYVCERARYLMEKTRPVTRWEKISNCSTKSGRVGVQQSSIKIVTIGSYRSEFVSSGNFSEICLLLFSICLFWVSSFFLLHRFFPAAKITLLQILHRWILQKYRSSVLENVLFLCFLLWGKSLKLTSSSRIPV